MLEDQGIPSVEFQERLRGTGSLHHGPAHSAELSFVLSRHRADPYSDLLLEFTAQDPQGRDYRPFLNAAGQLAFSGHTDAGQQVHVDEVYWSLQQGRILQARTPAVLLGERVAPAEPTLQWLRIQLTPNRIARPQYPFLTRRWDGQITTFEGEEKKSDPPQPISFNFGTGEFYLGYIYEDLMVSGVRSLSRIPVSFIDCSIAGAGSERDCEAFCQAITNDLTPLLRVLSLSDRRHVHWVSVHLTSHCDAEQAVQRVETTLLRGGLDRPGKDAERLVNAYRLPVGELDRVVERLRNSDRRHLIESAIVYVVEAHAARFVEQILISAFTALEATLAAASSIVATGEPGLLATADFDKLHKVLAQALENWRADSQCSSESILTISKKLESLNSLTLTDRAVRALVGAGVLWDDLWPTGTTLETGLRQAVKVRNLFLHSAQLADSRAAYAAALRVRALAERMIFKLLGCSDDWLDPVSQDPSNRLRQEPA